MPEPPLLQLAQELEWLGCELEYCGHQRVATARILCRGLFFEGRNVTNPRHEELAVATRSNSTTASRPVLSPSRA